jgi:hypothetical protein
MGGKDGFPSKRKDSICVICWLFAKIPSASNSLRKLVQTYNFKGPKKKTQKPRLNHKNKYQKMKT